MLAGDNVGGGRARVRRRAQRRHAGRCQGRACASSRAGRTANLVQSYGADFAAALEAAPSASGARCTTRDGWRAMRLDAITPRRPARFEALRGVVLQDWTDATLAEQRSAAVRALAKKYTVKIEERGPMSGAGARGLASLAALALLARRASARTR